MEKLLQRLPADELRRIRVPPQGVIFRAGQMGTKVFFVESGVVRLVRYTPAGDALVLGRFGAGELLGEASLGAKHYHCDAVAVGDVQLCAIPKRALFRLLREDPEAARELVLHLARQMRRLRADSERSRLRGVDQRLLHFLQSEGNAGAAEIGSLLGLAERLGVSHEALYRALAQLERLGRIARERVGEGWRIRVKNAKR